MILALGLLAAFSYGCWRARQARLDPPRARHIVAFVVGAAALGGALSGPLDVLSRTSFTVHMAQHMVLTLVAPPLLVLGASPLLRIRSTTVDPHSGEASRYVLATATVAALSLLVWHVPTLYVAALQHGWLHILEHLCFLLSAGLFWLALLDCSPRSRRGAAISPLLALFLLWMASDLLGAILTLSPGAIYATYVAEAHPWGWEPLHDQRMGGLIMWVGGGVSYALLMAGWLLYLTRQTSSVSADAP